MHTLASVLRRAAAVTATAATMTAAGAYLMTAVPASATTRTQATADHQRSVHVARASAMPIRVWPVLNRGSEGRNVRALQDLLGCWNKSSQPQADRIFGPVTERYVKDYQRQASLSVDGIVGRHTWTSLTGNEVFDSIVSRGSTGRCVDAAQVELRKHGYDIARDGIFGPRTERAVKDYQKKAQVTIDGIVGPHTWKALIAHLPR